VQKVVVCLSLSLLCCFLVCGFYIMHRSGVTHRKANTHTHAHRHANNPTNNHSKSSNSESHHAHTHTTRRHHTHHRNRKLHDVQIQHNKPPNKFKRKRGLFEEDAPARSISSAHTVRTHTHSHIQARPPPSNKRRRHAKAAKKKKLLPPVKPRTASMTVQSSKGVCARVLLMCISVYVWGGCV